MPVYKSKDNQSRRLQTNTHSIQKKQATTDFRKLIAPDISTERLQLQTSNFNARSDIPQHFNPVQAYGLRDDSAKIDIADTNTPIQRKIVIPINAYVQGLGVPNNQVTDDQIETYLHIAVSDDLLYCLKLAKNSSDKTTITNLTQLAKSVSTQNSVAEKITAIDTLTQAINTYLDANAQIYEDNYNTDKSGQVLTIPNRKTRYATAPNKVETNGYAHYSLLDKKKEGLKWGDDEGMWNMVGAGIGEDVENNVYSEAAPSNYNAFPLKQIPLSKAIELFPKPLINLIFDVRYQLETNGTTVIDERTPEEQSRKVKSPNAPGTLRSWHQDSNGHLPDNNFDADNIPADADDLHTDYTANSQSGAGSAIDDNNRVDAPIGYAEYTGTGSDWEHNTKIVLDYINKRVYLTLSHYQYCALVKIQEKYIFWSSGTQDFGGAQTNLQNNKKGHPGKEHIWLSPWMEIMM